MLSVKVQELKDRVVGKVLTHFTERKAAGCHGKHDKPSIGVERHEPAGLLCFVWR
jgi:hypothetical protein